MDSKKMKRGSVLLALVFLLFACEEQARKKQYSLHYSDAIMGTSFTVKIPVLPPTLHSDRIKVEIKELLDQLNSQLSTYDNNSELSRFNKSPSTQWQPASIQLYSILKEAKHIAEISNGAFDVTVGPLVNLWGFGPDPMTYQRPEDQLINEYLTKTGIKYLLIDDENQQIKKELAELYLDLSGIAKGYAVDELGLLLEKQGISNYMIEIGGELRLKGHNINNEPWRIAVEKPAVEKRMIQKVLPLSNISLATSGDYRNFFESDGTRFSHTLDPRTGVPITHKLASITILSDTTMRADALATALMVLGPLDGYKLAEQENIAALFIIKTEDGFVEKASSSFVDKLR